MDQVDTQAERFGFYARTEEVESDDEKESFSGLHDLNFARKVWEVRLWRSSNLKEMTRGNHGLIGTV